MTHSEDYQTAVAGERLLLYVEPLSEYREFHRYSVSDIRQIFSDAEVEQLNDEGRVAVKSGGVWIDVVFAAEHYARQARAVAGEAA